MKQTFIGEEHRVQIVAFDMTGESVPESLRKLKPVFSVSILPITANKSTPFYRGEQVYYGEGFGAAWGVLRAWVDNPKLVMPRRWKRFKGN
ncbi:hypothetical protein ABES02_29155 [Neobacillus pocheonensis]|uniref:hypothetical protein n=1 Tax=Neobacillus pocheonensis TaxID=363869 RepID=UPI003D28B3FC